MSEWISDLLRGCWLPLWQITNPASVRAVLAAAAAAAKALPSAIMGPSKGTVVAAEPLASRLDSLFPK